ncbi:MAG TPA: hypothetical protein VGM56_19175 [Byssovorax sp.]|jgi:stalled ribosome rescue protein Dom34
MTSHIHAAVWLDHQEAKIFHVDAHSLDEATLRAPRAHVHRHAKGPGEERERPEDLRDFFKHIAAAIEDADEILLLGPSTAKDQLLHYLGEHGSLAARVVAVETVDHPTDPQLQAHAKRHFGLAAKRRVPH